MTNDRLKLMIQYAIMIALTTVSTMLISIPTPGTKGFFNLGDIMVLLAAFLLGRKGGFIAGGIGSALADTLLGYTHWAPFTLIIKGIEGYLAGILLDTNFGKKHPLMALVPAALWMVLGYYIVEIFLYGWAPALIAVPSNLVQAGVGIAGARVLGPALSKTKLFENAPQH
jgi:uncharacterized membrane protein